ncbi:MAG: polyprenyl synthetase family protein [Myxococcales bacterium]
MTQPLVWPPESTLQPSSERVTSEGDFVRRLREEFDEPCLSQTLDAADEGVDARHWQAVLCGPLLELLGRDGKGFRSRLVEVAYALGAGDAAPEMPRQLPLIVEALHAGSLIIDDIEDDSKYRRGKPALHCLVGVPLALNAGNWLYFMPHRLLEELKLEPRVELALRRAVDRAVLRCHYGQALDLGVRLGTLAQGEVFELVNLSTRLKTGSLLELAAEVGAIAGGADAELCAELSRFARKYGVALQMLDDTSGIYQAARAHKGHEDLLQGRPTWPWAWLSRRLDELGYSRLQHHAQAVVRGEMHPEALASALRRHLGDAPNRAVHRQLQEAFARLQARVKSAALLAPLVDEIERLEAAYV